VVADLENIRFEATPRANLRFQPSKVAHPALARLGRWRRTVIRQTSRTGHFRATVENFSGTLRYHWHVAGTDLLKKQGTLDIGSQKATYQIDQDHLILTLQAEKLPRALEFLVKVTVNDQAGNAISSSKCVKFAPFCKSEVGVIPVFDLQVDTFHQHFSVVRLPLATLEPTVEPTAQQPSKIASRKRK